MSFGEPMIGGAQGIRPNGGGRFSSVFQLILLFLGLPNRRVPVRLDD